MIFPVVAGIAVRGPALTLSRGLVMLSLGAQS